MFSGRTVESRGGLSESPRIVTWLRKYWIEASITLSGLIAINAIFLAGAFRNGLEVDPVGAGQLGDFVGGFIGTFFALVSVVLLFSTLKSNRESAELLSFETKYFELIKMHRENVVEIEVQGVFGRKFFVALVREFRSILTIVKRVAARHDQNLSQERLIHVSYYCLFFGTGPNSSRMLKHFLTDFDRDFIDALERELDRPEEKEAAQREKKLVYVPFEGHQSRLGHYFRHLYRAVSYVDKRRSQLDSYEYVKTIRAQLSTHEQAILLLNSMTPLGRNWWLRSFILDYKMVKNLPREFFDAKTELDLSRHFPADYFEWEQVVIRPTTGK